MRNCPMCGRIWRRPTWDWANRATRWTLCSAFPSSLLARPARIRSRVRRRRDEEERETERWRDRETERQRDRGTERQKDGMQKRHFFSSSPRPSVSPSLRLCVPLSFKEMPELKLENSLVDDRYEVAERLNRGSFAE